MITPTADEIYFDEKSVISELFVRRQLILGETHIRRQLISNRNKPGTGQVGAISKAQK